ncbi:MAG: V-type ATP synthase subunit D [Ruminococcus sp.]|nr:V-type ATP synthase subunit D [Candidatus Copronaster equi]
MASQVFPTKNNLMATKKSLSLAKLGYDLMDRKKNILVREMMGLIDKVSTIQSDISSAYAQAYNALQQAQLTMGDCTDFAECVPVDDSLQISSRSVMGVELPSFSVAENDLSFYYGLNSTNSLLDEAYLKFNEVKQLTVQLAEIESNVMRLADAIKKTQKRTNALNNVMIPKFTSTVKFISDALDEKEREDFSRLKVIKRQKESAE